MSFDRRALICLCAASAALCILVRTNLYLSAEELSSLHLSTKSISLISSVLLSVIRNEDAFSEIFYFVSIDGCIVVDCVSYLLFSVGYVDDSGLSYIYFGVFGGWVPLRWTLLSSCHWRGIRISKEQCLCLPSWSGDAECQVSWKNFSPLFPTFADQFTSSVGWMDLIVIAHLFSIFYYVGENILLAFNPNAGSKHVDKEKARWCTALYKMARHLVNIVAQQSLFHAIYTLATIYTTGPFVLTALGSRLLLSVFFVSVLSKLFLGIACGGEEDIGAGNLALSFKVVQLTMGQGSKCLMDIVASVLVHLSLETLILKGKLFNFFLWRLRLFTILMTVLFVYKFHVPTHW